MCQCLALPLPRRQVEGLITLENLATCWRQTCNPGRGYGYSTKSCLALFGTRMEVENMASIFLSKELLKPTKKQPYTPIATGPM